MVGERLGVIIKGGIYGDSRFEEEYSSSFINRWCRWLGQNDIFEKEKALEKSQEQIKRLRQNSGIFLEQSRWQHLYLKRMHRNL